MAIKATEISDLIKQRIEGFKDATEARNVGAIVSVTDGICRIYGLADARYGEMLEFPGNIFGLALNLEQDSVGAVVLGEYKGLREGDTVKTTGRILEVPVGPELLGRVVDALKNEQEGVADVTITAATALDAKQQETLSAALTRRLQKKVRLHTEVDATLIGGAVIRSGDLVIDGSLRTRLERMAFELSA